MTYYQIYVQMKTHKCYIQKLNHYAFSNYDGQGFSVNSFFFFSNTPFVIMVAKCVSPSRLSKWEKKSVSEWVKSWVGIFDSM